MGLLKKDKGKPGPKATVQTVNAFTANSHPFSALHNYMPFTDAEYSLYTSLREAVPVIDAAICKTVRLLGTFTVLCDNSHAQQGLDRFVDTVGVNGCNTGILSFVYSYFEQLLTYGTAVGEMVPANNNSTIGHLYNASLQDVVLQYGTSPLDVVVCRRGAGQQPLPYQQLLCTTLLSPKPGTIKGTSVLQGLPFVSSVLLKIFQSIGTNWDRVGNVRFAVTYKPPEQGGQAYTRERAMEIANEWSKAMRDPDQVCDFVSVGDVSIKVIGADNQVLDCDVPVKHILEQIIAKLSIPPFLLGISWSTTERMSKQQADILTSEMDYYRLLITPVIKKICNMWMQLNGYEGDVRVKWDNINLQDEVELATARLTNAQAQQIEQTLASAGIDGEAEL